jgi:hypothetical protein
MKNIGTRETATITKQINPTWGDELEILSWCYSTEDGIDVELKSYQASSVDTEPKFGISVIHTDENGFRSGNNGTAVSLTSAKRWITYTIRQTRESIARRISA